MIDDYASMIRFDVIATDDPLGLGGLLADAHRIAQLGSAGRPGAHRGLVEVLLGAADEGMRRYLARGELGAAADDRLAFRELGLAIGLAALGLIDGAGREAAGVARLRRYLPIRAEIEDFWRDPDHRRSTAWLAHEDINAVMLATSLAPEGFLIRPPIPPRAGHDRASTAAA
jgi:hypothetical protein